MKGFWGRTLDNRLGVEGRIFGPDPEPDGKNSLRLRLRFSKVRPEDIFSDSVGENFRVRTCTGSVFLAVFSWLLVLFLGSVEWVPSVSGSLSLSLPLSPSFLLLFWGPARVPLPFFASWACRTTTPRVRQVSRCMLLFFLLSPLSSCLGRLLFPLFPSPSALSLSSLFLPLSCVHR